MLGITDGTDKCECHSCIEEFDKKVEPIDKPGSVFWDDLPLSASKMILCGTCGCKRCPKANNHRFACTGSNKTGQAGSAYP